jgi:hypothetical protein
MLIVTYLNNTSYLAAMLVIVTLVAMLMKH